MYQLLSQWTAEQTMDRGYDPDHLGRGSVHTRPTRTAGAGIVSRLVAPITRLRDAAELWVARGALGPRPDPCDPIRQGW
jgi:hypothetical protein